MQNVNTCKFISERSHLTGNWRNFLSAIYVFFVVAVELPLVHIKIELGDCANIDGLALFTFPIEWLMKFCFSHIVVEC